MPSIVGPKDVSPLMTVLRERWVLTLATSPRPADPHAPAGVPYPTPLFYAVADAGVAGEGPRLVFAGLYCESETVGELRGVQLQGEVSPLERIAAPAAADLRAIYLERHPVAAPH